MELFLCNCVVMVPLFSLFILSIGCSAEGLLPGNSRIRGVNLGGWLVIEGWIKPSLFDDIPNGDMLDGTEIQLKSVTLKKYISAENGGGATVTVDRDTPQSWETFRLWRVSESIFQFRTYEGQFLTCSGDGDNMSAVAKLPSGTETFYLERNNDNRVHIKLQTGTYIQASKDNQLTADYQGTPGWDDNAATFVLIIVSNNLHGDYQLANGYGHNMAEKVLKEHRNSFITRQDFNFLYMHGINTVRIPVGWWAAYDPSPPPPYIGGSLEVLDNAFSWAQTFGIKCIIDLHAAPGSQNGMEHSASRDGFTGWATPDYISKTLEVIDFLASRYAKHPALLGIELLNEPSAATVSLAILVSFYKEGYQTVRKYTSSAYVIFCQRIGNADPYELYQANLGEWVNEWFVNNGSQIDYQNFGRAQLDVYNAASFGWAYWTLKNDRKHWNFEWNILNNYIQLQQDFKTSNGVSSFRLISKFLLLLGFAFGTLPLRLKLNS